MTGAIVEVVSPETLRVLSDAWSFVLSSPDVFVAFVLWQLLLLYTVPVAFWDYELLRSTVSRRRIARSSDPTLSWDLDAVQVRILTIGNEAVVRETVASLPDGLDDVVVVAEEPIDVPGAEVLVVPDDFVCTATHKGRAVEWARRNHPTDREYVLYLDEDTDASALTEIPSNADVVQFRERPSRSGGLVPYLAEIHRIGFNVEQRAFPFLGIPFYAWGGGIAIRRSLEEEVTWDTPSIVEDSVFLWRAVREYGATLDVADVPLRNQAPPSVSAMIAQRRRWLTGTRTRTDLLPKDYRVLYQMRDLGWALSTVSPLLWLGSVVSYLGYTDLSLLPVFFPEAYTALSLVLLCHVYGWSLLGLVTYRPPAAVWVYLLVFTPLVVTVHSAGALYGLLRPAKTFAVTRKVVEAAPDGVDDALGEVLDVPTDDDAPEHLLESDGGEEERP
ncbi:glycosyltransferase [Halobaculum marinum]|uniref:Glycosyltransferase n=1 Tax=Halobaculum marinum TaxID=3031996 RepID=A0ABD5WX85_9EURY|nr:glycosyltransferase family 2 protein [Halobaculum sp. DT55]